MKTYSIFLKNIICILTLLFSVATSYAQIVVDSTPTVNQLVQNLLSGSGITATNITYSSAQRARGTFNGVNSNIGLSTGIILCNGNIVNAIGPNNQTNASATNTSFPNGTDIDLDSLMYPSNGFDATILEFDFIAISDTLKINYVFASEEYMEYISSVPGGINDGFGIFISGPGISGNYSLGAKNIALISGTSLPVTMFNLNLNSYGQYYFDNGNGQGTGTSPDGLTVQYDGFTVPLTAISALQCGQTYHIKIAIGDGGDYIIDSGLFLEEGCFSNTGASLITQQPINQNVNNNSNAQFTVSPSIPSSAFQWQENSGLGFVNLSNNAVYSGVTNDTLLITNVTFAMNNYLYRCIITDTLGGCLNISTSALLTVNSSTGLNDNKITGAVLVYPNPSNGTFQFFNLEKESRIEIYDITGRIVFQKQINDNKSEIDLSEKNKGIYSYKVTNKKNGEQHGKIVLQ